MVSGSSETRKTGVEIEFGGVEPSEAAETVARALGGTLVDDGPGAWRITSSQIGAVKVYLDTALLPEDHSWLSELAVSVGRTVIPMEIVTEPLAPDGLGLVEDLLGALRRMGAEGTRQSLVYGFGLHLNPALADPETGRDLPRVACAFALLETWLRARDPLDVSRRILPFVEPFPDAFVMDMARGRGTLDLAGTFDALDAHVHSRNHGLDLLPAYAHLAPARFNARSADQGSVSARPAYHYRMPETRLGHPRWSLGYDWTRWQLVERVAQDPARLADLADVWLAQRSGRARRDDDTLFAAITDVLGALAPMAPEGGPGGER